MSKFKVFGFLLCTGIVQKHKSFNVTTLDKISSSGQFCLIFVSDFYGPAILYLVC